MLAWLAEDAEDLARYPVYADWLASTDREHAELIIAHHQLATFGEDPDLRAHATMLERRLAPLTLESDERLLWRCGFVKTASLRDPRNVDALVALPVGRLLRDLYVGANSGEALARVAARATELSLDRLLLGERFPDNDDLAMGILLDRIDQVWSCGLDELHLRAGRMVIGDIDAPTLRVLALEGGIDLIALATAKLPRLEALHATRGGYRFGAYRESGMFDGDALCEVLARSSWAAQLKTLRLIDCGITQVGMRALGSLAQIAEVAESDDD